jgi:glyoxylase-like metal-dependent hydrolase (beta-lactamase superfamily II)
MTNAPINTTRRLTFRLAAALAGLSLLSAGPAHAAETKTASAPQAQALKLQPYNAGAKGLFPVASVLIEGRRDAILVDAQFGRAQAEELVQKIRDSGKRLTTIYISHGDPDYYFGLETIHAAFPEVKILATAPTIAHIKETRAAKLAFWGPKMGADAPGATIVPQALKGDHLTLEGKRLQIIGLKGPQPDRTVLWIPSIKAVVGGILVNGNRHVWVADTQSLQSRKDWLAGLAHIEQLKPEIVIPGHYAEGAPLNLQSVKFTEDYLKAFDEENARTANSAELIEAMKKRFPDAGPTSSLELSAKVIKGEMKW